MTKLYTVQRSGLTLIQPSGGSELGGFTTSPGYVYAVANLNLAHRILRSRGRGHSIYTLEVPESRIEPDFDQIINRDLNRNTIDNWEEEVGPYYRIKGPITPTGTLTKHLRA